MEWNNGKQTARFEREQKKLREQYLKAGMTEEQIEEMYKFDKNFLNLQQKESRHTQKLDISALEDDDENESKNPLYKKFLEKVSKTDKYWEEKYDWVEQIEDEKLYKVIKRLPQKDLDLIDMIFIKQYSQTKVARILGVKKAAMSRKMGRIKKILKTF